MTRRVELTSPLLFATLAAASAILGALAGLNPPVALGLALGMAFIALVMVDLTLGVVLFTFVAFLLEVLPTVGNVSFAKFVGLIVALSWLVALTTRASWADELFVAFPRYAGVLALFIVWCVLSAVWAQEPGEALDSTVRFGLNMVLLLIVFAAVRQREHALWFAAAFIAGVLACTFYGNVVAPGDLDAAAEGRLSGAKIDSNYLATWLVAGTALCVALAAARNLDRRARALAMGAAALCLLAVLLTVSRTGLVALLATIVASIAFAGPGRRLPILLIAVTTAGLVVLYFGALAPTAARERVTNLGGGAGRTDIWTVGWRMVEAHPLRGVGAGNFRPTAVHFLLEPGAIQRDETIVDKPKVAHNIYLEALAELGVVGLTLFLIIVLAPLACALRAAQHFRRLRDSTLELLCRGLAAAIVAMLAGSFFNSQQYEKPIWLLLALGPAVLALARKSAAQERLA